MSRLKAHKFFDPRISALGICFVKTKADIKNISTKMLIAALQVVPKIIACVLKNKKKKNK